ncbi:MAG: CYTH domain-containing protein [Candidatus Woesearchaeota archaeon]
MPAEIEVKILNIDVKDALTKLERIGAKRVAQKNYTRIIFSLPNSPVPFDKWIRLRTDGKKTTIAYKCIQSKAIDGIKELEITVSDFEIARKLLNSIGMEERLLQKNKRIQYQLGKTEFCIDFWPKLEPYLEIESDSKENLKKAVALLGFSMEHTTTLTTEQIYRQKGIDINKIKRLV